MQAATHPVLYCPIRPSGRLLSGPGLPSDEAFRLIQSNDASHPVDERAGSRPIAWGKGVTPNCARYDAERPEIVGHRRDGSVRNMTWNEHAPDGGKTICGLPLRLLSGISRQFTGSMMRIGSDHPIQCKSKRIIRV
jgi:hypothetical protein